MKVVWDLDGVLRDLSGYIVQLYGGPYPNKWDFVFGNGSNIYTTINENLDILIDAPPTAYCNVMKGHFKSPEIWTSQPKAWQQRTMDWIRLHIGKEYTVHFLKTEEKERKLAELEDTVLIEDSPNFKDYERIVLIDRPYNQDVKAVMRIYGTKHLNNMVEIIKEK